MKGTVGKEYFAFLFHLEKEIAIGESFKNSRGFWLLVLVVNVTKTVLFSWSCPHFCRNQTRPNLKNDLAHHYSVLAQPKYSLLDSVLTTKQRKKVGLMLFTIWCRAFRWYHNKAIVKCERNVKLKKNGGEWRVCDYNFYDICTL